MLPDSASRKLFKNFFVCWKAGRGVLAEDQLAIDFDVKDASATLDQRGVDSRFRFDSVRQTGGLRGVVSLHAIGDANVHDRSPFLKAELLKWNQPYGASRGFQNL